MADTTEVIRIRIDALEHTRQLVAVLAGSLTAAYTAIGVFSANQRLLFDASQVSSSWFHPPWNFIVLMLLVTVGLTNLCFVLAVFLLTDSIHNYSKIPEYRQSDLFTNAESEVVLAHQRGLTSDDFGYFCVRVGTFFVTYNLLLVMLAVITGRIQPLSFHIVLVSVLICGLVAQLLVLYCYRVSHYRVPEYSFGKLIVRFWSFWRWRDAARSSGILPAGASKETEQ